MLIFVQELLGEGALQSQMSMVATGENMWEPPQETPLLSYVDHLQNCEDKLMKAIQLPGSFHDMWA